MFGVLRKNRRLFSTLLIAETKNGVLTPGNLTALTAAKELKKPIDILILDGSLKEASLKTEGVRDVYVSNHDLFKNPTADVFSHAASNFIKSKNQYTHIVTHASTFSKDYFPRLAGLHDCQPISEVTDIIDETTFKRPTYAGNAVTTVKSSNPVHFINTRPTNFEPSSNLSASELKAVDSKSLIEGLPQNVATWVEEVIKKSERPDLGQAKIVVSGGRGKSV